MYSYFSIPITLVDSVRKRGNLSIDVPPPWSFAEVRRNESVGSAACNLLDTVCCKLKEYARGSSRL